MRILLDETTPRGMRCILAGHDVRAAPEMGWGAYPNGQLLDEAKKAGFDALVTCDQNFVFQQNLTGRNIAVVPSPTPRRGHFPSSSSGARADPDGLPIEAQDAFSYLNARIDCHGTRSGPLVPRQH
jgi:hypothetical protein